MQQILNQNQGTYSTMSPLRTKSISTRKKVDPIGQAVFYGDTQNSSRTSPSRYSLSSTPPTSSSRRSNISRKAVPSFYVHEMSQYSGSSSQNHTEPVSPIQLNEDEYSFPSSSSPSSSPTTSLFTTQFIPPSPHGLTALIENWNLATPPHHPPPRHGSTFGIVASGSTNSVSTTGTELRSPPDLPRSQGFHSRILLPTSESPTDTLGRTLTPIKPIRRSSGSPPSAPISRSPFIPSPSHPAITQSPGNRSPAPVPFRQPSWSDVRRGSVLAEPLNVHHQTQQNSYFFPPPSSLQIQPLLNSAPLPRSLNDQPAPISYDLFTPGYNMGGPISYTFPAPNALELSLGATLPSASHTPGTFGSFSQPPHPAEPSANSIYSSTHISAPSDPAKSTVAAKHLEGHLLPHGFIRRYILADELGSGGFGFVCSANMTGVENEFGKEVAVKFIFKERLENTKDALVDGEPMESWVLRGCDHPNIIAWIDLFEDNRFFILVQELHGDPWSEDHTLHTSHPEPHTDPGRRLSLLQTPAHRSPSPMISPGSPQTPNPFDFHMTNPDGSISRPRMGRRASHDLFEAVESVRFTEEEAKWIFKQIVSGVSYLHGKGIYHRDLKDENIVIDRYLNVKIIDFGSAVVEDHLQAPNLYGSFRGTYSYASPEVIQGSWYHASPCDVWSIGIILAILLTGEQPFPDQQHSLTGRFKLKRPTSEGARDLMEKVFRPDPTRRWPIERVEKHRWLRNVKRPRGLAMPSTITTPVVGLGMGNVEDQGRNFKTVWDGMKGNTGTSMGPPPPPLGGNCKFGGLPNPPPNIPSSASTGASQQGISLMGRLKKRVSA